MNYPGSNGQNEDAIHSVPFQCACVCRLHTIQALKHVIYHHHRLRDRRNSSLILSKETSLSYLKVFSLFLFFTFAFSLQFSETCICISCIFYGFLWNGPAFTFIQKWNTFGQLKPVSNNHLSLVWKPVAYLATQKRAFDMIFGILHFYKTSLLKFTYSEKATNFCEISTVYLSYVSSNGQIYP